MRIGTNCLRTVLQARSAGALRCNLDTNFVLALAPHPPYPCTRLAEWLLSSSRSLVQTVERGWGSEESGLGSLPLPTRPQIAHACSWPYILPIDETNTNVGRCQPCTFTMGDLACTTLKWGSQRMSSTWTKASSPARHPPWMTLQTIIFRSAASADPPTQWHDTSRLHPLDRQNQRSCPWGCCSWCSAGKCACGLGPWRPAANLPPPSSLVAAHQEQSGAITLGVDLGVCQGNDADEISHGRTIARVYVSTFFLAGFHVDAPSKKTMSCRAPDCIDVLLLYLDWTVLVYMHTWACVQVDGIDTDKNDVEERTYGKGKCIQKWTFFLWTWYVCTHRRHRHVWVLK